MSPVIILLLSGGGHTGGNVMAALNARRESVRLIATSDVATEPSLFAFDEVYLAPTLSDAPEAFEARVREIVAAQSPDLIIPCRDDDVRWLADFAARNPEWRERSLCGEVALADVINDKWLSFQFCLEHDLPFSASLHADSSESIDTFIQRVGLPLVAKPRRGAESRGIFLVTTRAQAARAKSLDGYVLQQYLGDSERVKDFLERVSNQGVPLFQSFEGVKHSIQVMIGPNGVVAHVACTLNQFSGRAARTLQRDDSPQAQAIGERCAEIFSAAGWRGPLNIQCQFDRCGDLKIHEFNGRFTGATAARYKLGIDEVGTAIRLFTGHEINAIGNEISHAAMAYERLAVRGADDAQIETLIRQTKWQRRLAGTSSNAH